MAKQDVFSGKEVIEQTKADLLAVTLFENRGDIINQKDVPACAGSLVPPLYTQKVIAIEKR